MLSLSSGNFARDKENGQRLGRSQPVVAMRQCDTSLSRRLERARTVGRTHTSWTVVTRDRGAEVTPSATAITAACDIM